MRERMLRGELYIGSDAESAAEFGRAQELLADFNGAPPGARDERAALLRRLLRHVGENVMVRAPFYYEYGEVSIGDDTFVNVGAVMLDVAPVTIGGGVNVCPGVSARSATRTASSFRRVRARNDVPMTHPRPFRIDVPDTVLTDLRERLARTRWPEPIPGTEWDYGAKVDTVRELCDYWRDGYDWRAAEADLNEVPGFLCAIDGVDLHFWHVRGSAPDAFPLLLIHGWPGSIYEFRRLLGPLSEQFDLVVPALPGFGFGGKPRERGWGVTRIAAAFDALMSVLGYERYGVQGGDWGGILAAKLGAAYPGRVAGIHVNYVIAPPPPDAGPQHADAIEQYRHWRTYEDAYSRLQRTKPDSLTVG